MQRIRKIYVNSSHRVSGTPSSFKYELPVDVDRGEKAHLSITSVSLPHIWYRAAISIPDAEGTTQTTSGVTLPGAPLVVVGSNGHVAWAFTNSYGDYADLVRLVPDAGLTNVIATASGTAMVDTLYETIEVAGADPVRLAVPMTPWGPVLYRDGRGDQYAVQWGAHRAEAANLRLLDLEGARTLDEALDIANGAGIPAQNFVAGDREGRVAWTIAGQIPARQGHDGSRPVDSTDPNALWTGFLAPADVPRVVDPGDGLRARLGALLVADDHRAGSVGRGAGFEEADGVPQHR